MKKPLLILFHFCFVSFLAINANSQVLFYEDFGGGAEPPVGGPFGSPYAYGPTAGGPGTYTFAPGFLLRNVDNFTPDGQVSYVNDAWEIREDFNFNVADYCAFSTSYYSPIGIANDWMWTPMVGPITANTVLSWNAVTYDPAYPDGYEVRVMTSAMGPPTGGTGVIGNQIANSTVIFTIGAENTSWTARSVSLAAFAGTSIWVGFRNNSNDKFLLLIDDIKIETIFNHNASLNSVNSITEYTLIPKSQVSPLPLTGNISNVGVNAITNVGMKVDVYDGSMTQIFTTTSPLQPSLASSANANFNAGTWTPPAIADTYTLKIYPVLTETDEQSTNDTITRTVVITDHTYARDDGNATGQLGIGAGNGGFLGQEFAIYNTARITEVSVYVTSGYTGSPIAAAVWDMSGGIPNTIIAYTDTLIYPDDSASYYNLPIDGGEFLLNPGNYVVTMIEIDSVLQVGLTNNIFTMNRTWVDWPTNPMSPWGNNEDYGSPFQKAYMIRPSIYPPCPADIITGTNATHSCGINDGTVSVTTTGTGPFTYNWSSGGTSIIDSNLVGGNYVIVVTDIYSSCIETDTVTVIDLGSPQIDNISITDPLCFNDSNGTATVFVSGGSPTYDYLWSNGGTIATQTGLPSGVYTITVTDSAGCQTDSVIVLNNPTVVGSSVIGIDESCAGCNDGSATVTPSGGTGTYTYSWAPSGGTGATASGLSPGIYTVTVTDQNGCSSTSTVTIDAFIGLEDIDGLSTLNIYPNPSEGLINISAMLDYTGDIQVKLLSIEGKLLYHKNLVMDQILNMSFEVDVAPGTYLIHLSVGTDQTVQPIIIR